MNKKVVLLFGLMLTAAVSFAQVSVNPMDDFYTDAQNWEIKGVVENLPPLRPYSLSNVKAILAEVVENGSPADVEKAEAYLTEYFGKNWKVKLEGNGKAKISNSSREEGLSFTKNLLGYPSFEGDVFLLDGLASVGYKIGFTGRTSSEFSFMPYGNQIKHDSILDPAKVGPFSVFLDANDTVSFGTQNTFLQAGINRTGYGAFLGNGLALSDSAYHMGNIGFTCMGNRFNYTQQMSVIGATRNTLDTGSTVYPDKFISFHAAELYFTENLHVSYYETMIFGNRFDPVYFVPGPYMALQGLNGCNDNLLMGINFEWKFLDQLLWAGDLFVDDLSVNDLVKFQFDTRIRIAAETGLIWIPELPVVDRVEFNFTAVTPYMYAHGEYETGNYNFKSTTVNYQNYTNAGQKIATQYEPNTGAVKLKAKLTPVKNFKLNVYGGFIAHGNICENLTDEEALYYIKAPKGTYSSDGSIYTHTEYYSTHFGYTVCSDKWRWLTQENLMKVFQFGFDGEYKFDDFYAGDFRLGKVSLTFAYDFEYIKNKGVDSNMFPGGATVVQNADGSYTVNSMNFSNASEVVKYYREAWKSGFYNLQNHYFSVGVKYTF